MLDTLDATQWDRDFSALFHQTSDNPPADLLARLKALPSRPGEGGQARRDAAVAQIFTLLVNHRFYALAHELDAAEGLRARIDGLIKSGRKLTDAADHDAMFSLNVLDTHEGGDPVRGKAGFARLRDMLPEGHHLIASCDAGINVAITLIGKQNQSVKPAAASGRGMLGRLLTRIGLAKPQIRSVREIRMVDFSATPDEKLLPWLDRSDVDEAKLTPEQLSWRRDGVVVLPNFLPPDLVDAYVARRRQLDNPAGWLSGSCYQHVPEMRALALYPKLMELQRDLLGEDMLLHLALTGWVSTERNWHQDDYLNPAHVLTWYTAVWMALDTIDPDCGPFEYIPGSHRWPLMSGEKVRALLTQEERDRREGPGQINHWATYSERFVAPAIEIEIKERGIAPVRFLGNKGDVLIWHSRLMHRGTAPRRPNLERRSLIVHYSGVKHRKDMPDRYMDGQGHSYAKFEAPLY